MGESERYMDRRLKKMTLGDDNNALMALIAINAMIFISFGLDPGYLLHDSIVRILLFNTKF